MTQIRRIKDYEVTGEIGRGGMGVVYKARHAQLDRQVALKVLPAMAASSEKVVQRFNVEASAAAQLSHPGIVQIFEAGESEGVHYIAMEYVSGRSFGDVVRDVWRAVESENPANEETLLIDLDSHGTFAKEFGDESDDEDEDAEHENEEEPYARRETRYWSSGLNLLVRLVLESARALEAAHLAGVLHRDIKPGNVLVTDEGAVKIVDFGLARIGEGRHLTLTGEIIGTPAYMSPEQLSTDEMPVDERTDVYALGVMLYEAISRRLPFEAPSVQTLIHRIVNIEPSSPRRWNRKIPRDLETVCLKAIEKDPSRRYQTMKEFADELQRFLNDEPILASPAGPITRIVKLVRRRRVAAIASAVALVAIVVAVVLGFQLLGKTLEDRMAEARDLVDKGLTASVLGSTTEAVELYTEAIGVYKKSVEARVYRGTERFVQGNLEQAAADFERGLEIQKDYPPLRVAYAAYLRAEGRNTEAEKLLQGLDISGIEDPLQLDSLGVIYSVIGDQITAIKMFQNARDHEPGRLSSIMGEGWAAFFLGRYDQADQLFQLVHTLVPKKKLSTLLLVYTRWHKAGYATGQYRRRILNQARAYINELSDAVGVDAMATLSCAAVDSIQKPTGDHMHEPVECAKKAITLFEQGDLTISEVPETLFYEIMALLLIDLDVELAGKYAEMARERSCRGLAQLVLGMLAERHGRIDEAQRHYRAVLAKAPQNPYALASLLRLRSGGDDARLVVPLAQRANYARQIIKVKPDAPQVSMTAGSTLKDAGDVENALVAYRHALNRWTALEVPEEARRVEAVIRKLQGGD